MTDLIQQAIATDQDVFFRYTDAGGAETERAILPYYVGELYVIGYCRARRHKRLFRWDRMKDVRAIPRNSWKKGAPLAALLALLLVSGCSLSMDTMPYATPANADVIAQIATNPAKYNGVIIAAAGTVIHAESDKYSTEFQILVGNREPLWCSYGSPSVPVARGDFVQVLGSVWPDPVEGVNAFGGYVSMPKILCDAFVIGFTAYVMDNPHIQANFEKWKAGTLFAER